MENETLTAPSLQETQEGQVPQVSNSSVSEYTHPLQKAHNSSWTDVEKAYLMSNWRPGNTNDARDAQKEICKYLGRTKAAVYAEYNKLVKERNGTRLGRKSTHKLTYLSSPNLTPAETQEILAIFGSFTPQMKTVVLSLRNFANPRIVHSDYQLGKLYIDFFLPGEEGGTFNPK